MNCSQANQIPIPSFLASIGSKPEYQKGTYLWYLSPLREEATASFKVDLNKNTWHDFGSGEGITLVDLVCHVFNVDIKGALARLDETDYSGIQKLPAVQKVVKPKRELILESINEIQYPPLFSYLDFRHIPVELAREHTKEIHYKIDKNGTTQKAIGFKNDWGSYEIRNKQFKSIVGKDKRITSVNTEKQNRIVVFEGFFDYLSFLCRFKNKNLECGYIIMNSTSNKVQTTHALLESGAKEVYFYLDNDVAGDECFTHLSENSNYESFDKREGYKEYEDYSDYHMANS